MIEKIIQRLQEEAREHKKYWDAFDDEDSFGAMNATLNAIKIVQEVAKEYGNGWISVEVAMPEEHESIFAKYKGTSKWDEDGMFEKISNEVYVTVENMKTGESTTTHAHTTDGKWSCDLLRWSDTYRIIAWMPLPPKYEPKEAPYQKGE